MPNYNKEKTAAYKRVTNVNLAYTDVVHMYTGIITRLWSPCGLVLTQSRVNITSGNDMMADGTMSTPKQTFTCH